MARYKSRKRGGKTKGAAVQVSRKRCGHPGPRRECGECRACCTILGVRNNDGSTLSEPNETCKHVSEEHGCTIYQDRPTTCRRFSCGWLEGVGETDDRPDKLGLMMMSNRAGNAVQLWIVRPGAENTPEARRWIAFFRRKFPVIVADATRRYLLQPTIRGKAVYSLEDSAGRIQGE